jgi:hypothetical protein
MGPSAAEEGFMYWTGFMTGILVGANLGIVIAGMLFAAKRGDVEALASETTMDYAVMGEVEETPGEMPSSAEPVTYLDSYPQS